MARCKLDVGCEECGVCYAEAHGQPEQCGHSIVRSDVEQRFGDAEGVLAAIKRLTALSEAEPEGPPITKALLWAYLHGQCDAARALVPGDQ
jgi:hypothetical protein